MFPRVFFGGFKGIVTILEVSVVFWCFKGYFGLYGDFRDILVIFLKYILGYFGSFIQEKFCKYKLVVDNFLLKKIITFP